MTESRRHAIAHALALGAVLAAFACAAPPVTGAARPLDGTYWRLVELRGQPVVGAGAEREAHLVFAADSNRVSGVLSCNQFWGSFTSDGAAIRFGDLASTKMACNDDRLMRQETDFAGALAAARRHEVVSDTLTLFGDAGALARLVAVAR